MTAKFFSKFRKPSNKPPKNGVASKEPPKAGSPAKPSDSTTSHTPSSAYSPVNPKPKSKINIPSIIAILLGVLIIMFVIGATLYLILRPSNDPAGVCMTPQCIGLANQLLNWKDNTTDPCDDFYQYTCGRYVETVISNLSVLVWKNELIGKMLTNYIVKLKNPKKKAEKAMKKVWEHCDEVSRNSTKKELDDQTLHAIFNDIRKIGKWPMIEAFNESEFNLSDYLIAMIQHLKPAKLGLFEFTFMYKIMMSSDVIQMADFNGVQTTIQKMLANEKISFDPATLQKALYDVIAFARKLPTPQEINEGHFLVSTNVADLRKRFKNIHFEKILGSLPSAYRETIINNLMLGPGLEAERKVDELIGKTSPRTLANFLIVRAFVAAKKLALGVRERGTCGENVALQLPQLSLAVMIRHYLDKKNLDKGAEILNEMKASMREMLEQSTWLQEESKRNALNKLDKMKMVVGYPREFMDLERIEKKFEKEVVLDANHSYYEFYGELEKFNSVFSLDELDSGQTWLSNYIWPQATGFFLYDANTMMITAPFLDDPLFDWSFPKFAQIASLYFGGSMIGTGFSLVGAKYGANGEQRAWCTSQDCNELTKRSKCVIDKYDNYDDPVYGKHLDGAKTVDANVYELLGARVAWDTYRKLDASKEQKLLGLEEYSTDALFFQIFASKLCGPQDSDPLATINRRVVGVLNYRVNGVLSNMKEFAETFNCPVGSKMNPEKKCPIY